MAQIYNLSPSLRVVISNYRRAASHRVGFIFISARDSSSSFSIGLLYFVQNGRINKQVSFRYLWGGIMNKYLMQIFVNLLIRMEVYIM